MSARVRYKSNPNPNSPSHSLAYVRLLIKPKPGLDPASFASYRPISLRDADYRILGRVLVKRLTRSFHSQFLLHRLALSLEDAAQTQGVTCSSSSMSSPASICPRPSSSLRSREGVRSSLS